MAGISFINFHPTVSIPAHHLITTSTSVRKVNLVLLLVLIGTCLSATVTANNTQKPGTPVYDTTYIQSLITTGDSLRGSLPDTAMNYFNRAVAIIQSYPNPPKQLLVLKGLAETKTASIYLYQGNLTLADSITKQVQVYAEHHQLVSILSRCNNMYGLLEFYRGNYTEALAFYEIAYRQADDGSDRLFAAKVYTNMAIVYFYQANYDNAVELFRKPVQVAREINDNDLLAGSLLNLGKIFLNLAELDSSIKYFQDAQQIYDSIHGTDGVILCYDNIAYIHYSKGEYDKALESYFEQIKLSKQINFQANIGTAYYNIGDIYMHLGDYETALKYMLDAVKIREELSDKKGVANTLIGIGELHLSRKDYSASKEYFLEADSLYQTMGYLEGKAKAQLNLASVLENEGEYSSAMERYDSALALYEKTGNEVGKADVYIQIGSTLIAQKNFAKAIEYLNKSQTTKLELDDKPGLTNIYYYLTIGYGRMGQYQKAIDYGQMSWSNAVETGSLPMLVNISYELMQNYHKANKPTLAHQYAQKHIDLKDSLLNSEKNKAMVHAEMKWQSERKQMQINQLKKENEIKQLNIDKQAAESRTHRVLLIALVVLLLLTITAMGFYLKGLQRKKQLESQKTLSDITKLKMQSLQNRVSPHFIFNTLHSTAVNLKQNPSEKKVLDDLSHLLRRSLVNVEKLAIPIQEEMEIIESFVQLHAISKKPEFTFKKDVRLNGDANSFVPAMILQIPVENAIKHGLNPKDGNKELLVSCESTHNCLQIIVEDNGVGLYNPRYKTASTGLGIKVLMQTIQLLNKQNNHKITYDMEDLKDHNTSGTRVTIRIPHGYNYQLT